MYCLCHVFDLITKQFMYSVDADHLCIVLLRLYNDIFHVQWKCRLSVSCMFLITLIYIYSMYYICHVFDFIKIHFMYSVDAYFLCHVLLRLYQEIFHVQWSCCISLLCMYRVVLQYSSCTVEMLPISAMYVSV